MKQTILVCDCCKEPRKASVATLSISDGARGTGGEQYDLCPDHLKGIRQHLRSIKQTRTVRLNPNQCEVLDKKIVAAVVASPGIVRSELAAATGAAPDVLTRRLRILQDSKTLRRTGKGSRGLKYFPAK